MPFDLGCQTYWCDKCGLEMNPLYRECSNNELIMVCKNNHRRHFYDDKGRTYQGYVEAALDTPRT